MIRHHEFDQEVDDPDQIDSELAALISRLNDSFAGIEDLEDAAADDCRKIRGSRSEEEITPGQPEKRQKPVAKLRAAEVETVKATAAPAPSNLPEELEELDHTYQSALFSGVSRSGKDREIPEAGSSKTGISEGSRSRVGLLGVSSLAVLTALAGAWYGSHIDTQFGYLNNTLAHLERLIMENRDAVQQTEQKLANASQLHRQSDVAIQRIERSVKELKLSTTAEIETLSEQIAGLQNAASGADSPVPLPAIPEPLIPVPKPSSGWGVNLASFATQNRAVRKMEKMHGAGIEVVVREALVGDKRWYRLRVPGFSSRQAAGNFLRKNRSQPDFAGAWISNEP